jgi:hypothetical protein
VRSRWHAAPVGDREGPIASSTVLPESSRLGDKHHLRDVLESARAPLRRLLGPTFGTRALVSHLSLKDRTMNRAQRKQVLQLKPYLDKLETRRLMSVGDPKSRFAHELAQEKVEFRSQLADGDLGAFALSLVQHPRMAAEMGLGAIPLN